MFDPRTPLGGSDVDAAKLRAKEQEERIVSNRHKGFFSEAIDLLIVGGIIILIIAVWGWLA
ncbi:hypothetical protein [Paenibacillus typhae]|uniref:hypothetical protein n=1 Tax=Paenibacillus typhae TaxID=1174501 RepID=UPI001C8D2F81|nr:hypothetical protein [Paenibacillus typhae]MBY0012632.1 hypothetical protein [Paenibacillus typhae]